MNLITHGHCGTVRRVAQRGTQDGVVRDPIGGGFGRDAKADFYPEETNKALSCQLGGEAAQK